jgi:hypothetical protein
MKFNLKLTIAAHYIEIGQKNPLRWRMMYREKDGSFVDQTDWIKCKDFFNDTVAYFKTGELFDIYGYSNKKLKNEEGVYFLLNFIENVPRFLANIAVMNEQLKQDLGCAVWAEAVESDPKQVMICIPMECWATTYRMSMVTFVIRLCNYPVEYKKWADFWAPDAPSRKVEAAFQGNAHANAEKGGFTVPAAYSNYWWFAGPKYNSEVWKDKLGLVSSVIHNNGVSNWSAYMTAPAGVTAG